MKLIDDLFPKIFHILAQCIAFVVVGIHFKVGISCVFFVFDCLSVTLCFYVNSVKAANILISKLEKSMSYMSINCNSTNPLVV